MIQIEACRRGDRQALGALYTTYYHKLLGIARYYVKDESIAEDILHDAFILIFTSIHTLKDDRRLEGWMQTIVRNLSLQYLKSAEHHAVPLSEAEESMPAEEPKEAEKAVDLDLLLAAINALPRGNREVFKLAVLDGYSHRQIAHLLGIAPHSSSSQLFRAKKMLRRMLADYWALLLLPLLLPLYLLLAPKNEPEKLSQQPPQPARKPRKSSLERFRKTQEGRRQEPVYKEQGSEGGTFSVPLHETSHSTAADSLLPAPPALPVPADSLGYLTANEPAAADSLPALPTLPPPSDMASSPNLGLHPQRTHYPWTFNLGYSSNPAMADRLSNFDYLTVIDYAGGGMATKIYSRNDYLNYLDRNRLLMDSTENAHLRQLAEGGDMSSSINVGEQIHHHKPITFSLSLQKQLNPRWTFGTGLTYTRLTTDIESTFGQGTLKKQQRADYVGIPLRLTYRLWQKGSFQAYATGGVTFELPVHGSLRKSYFLAPDSSFFTKSALHPGPQWSVNAGLGLQYQLFKPFSLYIEPNMNYYFRNGSGIETYRTEHPFVITVPFGLRLTW